jgi:hypothetical protein
MLCPPSLFFVSFVLSSSSSRFLQRRAISTLHDAEGAEGPTTDRRSFFVVVVVCGDGGVVCEIKTDGEA